MDERLRFVARLLDGLDCASFACVRQSEAAQWRQ